MIADHCSQLRLTTVKATQLREAYKKEEEIMTIKRFPNPCCQCGMCCLSTTCIIGQTVFNIPADEPCHALQFEGVEEVNAVCRLAEQGIVPTGDGCCIKARAYNEQGECIDFSSLSPKLKKEAVRQIREGGIYYVKKKA